jgi:type II secretory pathway pseudopilin PulG
MKIRLLLALVGVAIGLALPTFAQRTNTPDPEVRQQIEAARLDIEQLRREGKPPTAGLRREEMRR